MDPKASKETMPHDDPSEISIEITAAVPATPPSPAFSGRSMEAEVFHAAAEGEGWKLEKYDGDQLASRFLTPTKNTILHVYLTAQAEPITPVVQYMLSKCPSLGSQANLNGETPLHIAARYGHHQIAMDLITRAAAATTDDSTMMMRKINAQGDTALHEAVRYEHADVAKLLVGKEDPEFTYSANFSDESPLYMAVERNSRDLVTLILGAFTAPAYGGPNGKTAAHAAVIRGLRNITKDIVMKKGLEHLTREVDHQGRSPLHYAAHTKSDWFLEWLLSYDKSAAYLGDNDGMTALHIAAGKNLSLEPFLKYCPDCFEMVDKRGRNALHFAVESRSSEAVTLIFATRYLRNLKNMKDEDGNTPLHLLVASGENFDQLMIHESIVDRMAFNNKQLKIPLAQLMIKSHKNSDASSSETMISADIVEGLRVLEPEEDHRHDNNKRESGNTIARGNSKKEDGDLVNLKEAKEAHLVVAALIATVTFAAGFTMPGGYIQESGPELGLAALTASRAFKAFVISDTIALVFSGAAVFIHLLIAMNTSMKRAENLFNKALPLTLYALLAMVIAFITGTYAVLGHSLSLAIAACVVGCLFFILYGYILGTVLHVSLKIGQGFLTCFSDFIIFITCQGLCMIRIPNRRRDT